MYFEYGFYHSAESGYCTYCRGYVSVPANWNTYYDTVQFTVNVTTDYTVKYEGEGVTTSTQRIRSNSTETKCSFKAAAAPSREGYTFKGWQFSEDNKIYPAGSTVTMNWTEGDGANVVRTMTAQW